VKAKRVRKLEPEAPLLENAARIIRTRLEEMRSFAPAALQPERAIEQHDLRIAAKRLRYVLEVTGFCFGPSADTARRRARDIQTVLGDLHDCDVMLPRVAAHVKRLRTADAEALRKRAGDARDLDVSLVARAPHRTSYRGLEVLAVHVEARRGLLFNRFVELWGELERDGTWDRLGRAIDREVRERRERRAAIERAERAACELEVAERAERKAAERARRAADELAEARRIQGDPGAPT
jgi:CHAD domain-containing protein